MVTIKQIEWSGGEVSDGAVSIPGTYTTVLENISLDDQKQPIVREANNYHSSFLPPAGVFSNSEVSQKRNWEVIASIGTDGLTVTITIIDLGTGVIKTITLTSTTTVKKIYFREVDKTMFSTATIINTVVGPTAFIIHGLDKLYFLDDGAVAATPAAKEFKIKTNVSSSATVTGTKDGAFIQGRYAIACTGPNLTAGQQAVYATRVLMSYQGVIDDFTQPTTGSVEIIASGAIDAMILTNANEEFYGLSVNGNMLIITTSLGIRVLKASDENDVVITKANITNYVAGIGDTINARALPFDGFVIFATKYTLRAKMLQSLETNYVNTVDLILPILNTFDSQIRDVNIDYNGQNVVVFTVDGNIHSITSQSLTPSKSYNLSLPMTSSFVSPGVNYLAKSPYNPSYLLIESTNSSGMKLFTLSYTDSTVNYFGDLLDGAREYKWQVQITSGSGNKFTALFDFSFASTANIIGIWVKLPPNNNWCFFATDKNAYPVFTTSVPNISMASYNSQKLDSVLVVSKNGYEVLPTAYQQVHASLEYVFDISDTDGNQYSYEYYCQPPIAIFGDIGTLDTTRLYQGVITTYIALAAPKMVMGWRDMDTIANFKNIGGIRGSLLSPCTDLEDHLIFYNNNASISAKTLSSSTEIEFQTIYENSYGEKTIEARACRFKPNSKVHKFTRLLGQY